MSGDRRLGPLNPPNGKAIAAMDGGVEVIAGIGAIITGLSLGFEQRRGPLMTLLGILVLLVWLVKKAWML